jgi:aryl-alcohol dehydrogenase-like predicted oxidoreductase
VRIEESLEAMERLVRAGKVRALGASNYASWQVCQMCCLAEQHGWEPLRVVQPMYNLLARGIEQEFLPMSREFALGVVAYNPLAGGLLTGKQPSDAPLPGTRFDRMPAYRDRYWHPANFAAVEELSQLARAEGRSLAGLALCWLVYHRGIAGIVLGASRLEQLQENLAALDAGPLSSETLAGCERVGESLRGAAPKYNR